MWRTLLIACSIAALFAGCNRTSPEELMTQAQQALDMQNFPMAIEVYTRVIADHSRTLQADTAAFMIPTIYNNDLREYEKAIGAYRDYLARYPEGSHAPTALFLIAYLYNNELHNLDSAAATYRAFLAAYPDHEMVASARFELDNLGKPADMLIPQDTEPVASKDEPVKPRGRP
jgi:outer membrane protein assembly factor BamD (BamD/ComL family)